MSEIYWAFPVADGSLEVWGSDDEGPDTLAIEAPELAQWPHSTCEVDGVEVPCVSRGGVSLVLARDSDSGLVAIPRLPPVPELGDDDLDARARAEHGELVHISAYEAFIRGQGDLHGPDR